MVWMGLEWVRVLGLGVVVWPGRSLEDGGRSGGCVRRGGGFRVDGSRVDGFRVDGFRVDGFRVDGSRDESASPAAYPALLIVKS